MVNDDFNGHTLLDEDVLPSNDKNAPIDMFVDESVE